jgi:hypothetical protein
MLFPSMPQEERLNRREQVTRPARASREPLEHRAWMLLECVAVYPHPIVHVLATPQMRLAAGLVFEDQSLTTDLDSSAKAGV